MTIPPITPSIQMSLTRSAGRLQSLVLAVVPHGGQRSARANAWSAMSADAALARNRRESERALRQAAARAGTRAKVSAR